MHVIRYTTLVQDRHGHRLDAVRDFFRRVIADGSDPDIESDGLAGHGVVAVNGQLAVFNARHGKLFRISLVIHHFDLGTDALELGRNIRDVVGIGQVRIVWTKSFIGCQ